MKELSCARNSYCRCFPFLSGAWKPKNSSTPGPKSRTLPPKFTGPSGGSVKQEESGMEFNTPAPSITWSLSSLVPRRMRGPAGTGLDSANNIPRGVKMRSPQQIAGWLREAYPDDPTMRVSHETIYLSLFVQSRGVLNKALLAHLRQRRTYRRPKSAAAHPGGHIVDAVSIRERPATVEDRAVPGHWEGDLLVGSRNSYIATSHPSAISRPPKTTQIMLRTRFILWPYPIRWPELAERADKH